MYIWLVALFKIMPFTLYRFAPFYATIFTFSEFMKYVMQQSAKWQMTEVYLVWASPTIPLNIGFPFLSPNWMGL